MENDAKQKPVKEINESYPKGVEEGTATKNNVPSPASRREAYEKKQGHINYDSRDGFGNAQWDDGSGKIPDGVSHQEITNH